MMRMELFVGRARYLSERQHGVISSDEQQVRSESKGGKPQASSASVHGFTKVID